MGKTTNALEELLRFYMSDDAIPMVESFYRIKGIPSGYSAGIISGKESSGFHGNRGSF